MIKPVLLFCCLLLCKYIYQGRCFQQTLIVFFFRIAAKRNGTACLKAEVLVLFVV